MQDQTRDLRVRGNRCDIIKGDIRPAEGQEQTAYKETNFELARLVYSFLFAYF